MSAMTRCTNTARTENSQLKRLSKRGCKSDVIFYTGT